MAKHPVTFFIRMGIHPSWELENICLENGETNENLMIVKELYGAWAFVISRYPMASNSEWIQANGQEILEFAYFDHDRMIYLG
jgi:hypothetical protein